MAEKTEAEVWEEYVEEQREQEKRLAEQYAEAGTSPPGVLSRAPDTTSPEANYVSRDNIVVSGASPYHLQAAVAGLGDEETRNRALDAADVAGVVDREAYEQAVLSAQVGVPEEAKPEHPGEQVSEDAAPKATGGTQPDEDADED